MADTMTDYSTQASSFLPQLNPMLSMQSINSFNSP
jgi:hypothetical protein